MAERLEKSTAKATRPLKLFHIDGAGARPDGSGSGFAWVRLGTQAQRVYQEDELTNNAAEYRALLSVLKYLAEGSRARVFTDSQLVCEQFHGRWSVNDPKLIDLRSKARDLIQKKLLDVDVRWIPRRENLAGKLLEKRKLR
jgi:ribonuclease HI